MADNPTFVEYTGVGAQTDFVFPFSYLSADHIKVTVAGVARTFTLPSQNTVRIAPAPNGLVRIARVTPGTALVTWNDGAVILGKDLNLSTKQPVNVAEEARDIAAEAKEIAQTAISGALEAAADAIDAAADAQVSKTAAAASAGTAATSQAAAAASATTASGAATKATEAGASATTATTKAGEATTSASTATTRASEAAASAATANTKASEASTSAGTATTKASEASASATQAAASASSAAATRTLVEGIYDSFDDRYLGLKTADPTVDNDGAALVNGAIYFNTTLQSLRLFTSSGWQSAYIPSDGSVASFNNRTGSVVPVAGDYDVAKITGLQTALDGKATTGHTHTIANIASLQTTLDGKAASTHDHATQDIFPNTLRWTRVRNLTTGTDLDTVKVGGLYDIEGAVNKPAGSSFWGYLTVRPHSNNPAGWVHQEWFDLETLGSASWVRTATNSVWGPWQRVLFSNALNQSITGGARTPSRHVGSFGGVNAASFTPDAGNGPHQTINNTGAFTINPPADDNGSIAILLWHDTTAGAVTFANTFHKVDGDPIQGVSGKFYLVFIYSIAWAKYANAKALN